MKQILCFGDSNTYGLIPGSKDRYEWKKRWTGQLEEQIHHDGYRIIEEGLCGRTSVFEDELRAGRRGADILPVLLETHRPLDGIILMLGTNDCKRVYGASAEVIGKGIEKLLLQIQADNPVQKVLLISPILLGEKVWEEDFDPEFDERSVETSRRLKDIYKSLATKYGCEFLAASDYAVPSEADREHLDEAGHHQLAQAIYQKLKGVWEIGL
jgi:lysophospholipase L1-like esterase